jgi:hypothetical protein
VEIRIGGKRIQTIHLQTYELGTDRIVAATLKSGPAAVTDARIWTSATYQDQVGLRLAGGPTWDYPGSKSLDGFVVGDLAANEEKSLEIKVNLVSPPGRPGENLVPLFVGHGGEA